MKYKISNRTGSTCTVTLVPQNSIEEKMLKTNKEEDAFTMYYVEALEKHIDPDAALLGIAEYSTFPSPVTLKYIIAKGIG